MEKILVTGSSGFIGMHLCKSLLDEGYRVLGIDNMNDYYTPALKETRLEQLSSYLNFNFIKTDIADQLAGVVSWGGYSDMGRILTFQMTGRHEWQGKEHTLTPDPYARWIVAGNYLPFVPEYREAQDVADALLHLAFEAGNRRVSSLSPSYDPLLKELATKIAPERKELFELFAPRSDQEIDIAAASRMATRLTECATTVTPLLNPGPYLPKVLSEVHLFHGRTDSLIPYTETLLAQTLLPQHRIASSTITGLFEHSERGNRLSSVFQAFGEVTSLVRALNRVLGTV